MTAFILAALLAASEPSAAASAAQTAPAAQPAKKDADKMVCRWDDSYGSRVKTRTCKTKAQWEADEANAQRFIRDSINHGVTANNGNQSAPPL